MAQDLSEEEVCEEAKKTVKAKRGFYGHLGSYLAVNTILIVIWALSDADLGTANMWFLWPLCIWGAFVLLNFLQVFVFKTSTRGEKAAIEKEAEKIKKEQG
ncbi:2TM domain-containing protein [Chloroflexota bacterium]